MIVYPKGSYLNHHCEVVCPFKVMLLATPRTSCALRGAMFGEWSRQ